MPGAGFLFIRNAFIIACGTLRAAAVTSAVVANNTRGNGAVVDKISTSSSNQLGPHYLIGTTADGYSPPTASMSTFVREKMKSWGITPEIYDDLQDRYLRGGKRSASDVSSGSDLDRLSPVDLAGFTTVESDEYEQRFLPRESARREVALRRAEEEAEALVRLQPVGRLSGRNVKDDGPEFWDVVAWIGTQAGKAVRKIFNGLINMAKAIYVGIAYGWNEAGPGRGSSPQIGHE